MILVLYARCWDQRCRLSDEAGLDGADFSLLAGPTFACTKYARA